MRQELSLGDHQRIKDGLSEPFHSAELPKPHFKLQFCPLIFSLHLCHLPLSSVPTWVCGYCLLSLHVPRALSFSKEVEQTQSRDSKPCL